MRVVAAAAAVVLAGCTPGGPTPRADPPISRPAASPTASLPPPPAAPAGVTVVSVPRGFSGGFTTPSGNVACELTEYHVRCDARQRPWRELPEEDQCGGTARWRTRLVLDADAGAALRGECGYDPPVGGPPLAYGTRIDLGTLRCHSERTGLTCWVAGTRRGFSLSRARYRLTADPPPAVAAATPPPTRPGRTVAPRGFHGGFVALDHSVVCDVADARVHCLVSGRWAPPPATEPCVDGDRSTEVILRTGRGRAFTGCRTDSLAGGDRLGAGASVRVGDVVCTATRDAVECRNDATRHGFVVNAREFQGY